jgi:NADH-quinone oxidoreductase subunit L
MISSSLIVIFGWWLSWKVYGDRSPRPSEPDALETASPMLWGWLSDRLYVDELYGATVIAFYGWWARVADWLDRRVWGGAVAGVAGGFALWARLNRFLDANVVDGGFDNGCAGLAGGGGLLARVQSGRVQSYLRIMALGVVALGLILIWSSRG